VFGEFAYDVVPGLTLNAGIRGFIAKNTLFGFSGGFGAFDRQVTLFGCTGSTVQQCPNIDKKYVESGETHKINLTWQIDPERMIYATYSTGFRPGGNNRDAFALGQLQSLPPYKADTLTNYEIGWKTAWLNRTLRINGALFWEVWKDVQYAQPGILGIFYTVNAGTARSRGIEADINWQIGPLTLSGSGTYVDPQLTEAFAGSDGVVQAPDGARLPIQPKFKINATARYDFTLGNYGSFVQASVNHQSNSLSALTTLDKAALGPKLDGFTTFDFSLGTRRDNWTFSLFIQNAFDERGILSYNTACAVSFCAPYKRSYPIKPQLFGVRVGQRF